MAIDIFSVEPHKVSRDLKGYAILIYGDPKTGKTTIASKFPKSLLLAFEKGYSALPGVMAQPLDSWPDMLRVVKQLDSPEGQERYENIIIDTADLAYDAVEEYICNLHGVDAIGDIPFGKGYSQAAKELDKILQKLRKLGYGIILISHAQDRTITDEQGKEFNRITPTLANTPRKIVNRFVDIMGYAKMVRVPEEGEKTFLHMRATVRFEAGSRFPYTPPHIEFNYNELVNAIVNAIEKQEEVTSGSVTDQKQELPDTKPPTWDEVMAKFKEVTDKAVAEDEENKKVIVTVIEEQLGVNRRVTDLNPNSANAQIVELIVENLEHAFK